MIRLYMKNPDLSDIVYLLTAACFTIAQIAFSQPLQDDALRYLFPPDGAEWVAPESPIIVRFQTVRPEQIRNLSSFIRVNCAKTGEVKGKTILSDDSRTVIFYPENSYAFGDTVSVSFDPHRADRPSEGVYTFSFHVAGENPFQKKSLTPGDVRALETGTAGRYAPNTDGVVVLNGISVPSDFPYIDITVDDNPDPGYIFCNYAGRRYYNLILDNSGYPLFYWIVPDDRRDFKHQDTGILTMKVRQGFGGGGYIALDNTYSVVDTFFAPPGYTIDEHELLVLKNGHYLVTAMDTRTVDMSRIVPGGRKNALVTGYHLIEMDNHDNPVFIWRCWDHYAITDAEYVDLTQPNIDYLHMNSIAVDLDGHYLICPKLLNEITKINRETGEIIWRLGGKMNQFEYVGFDDFIYMQHSICVLPNGNYTVFDNGNYHHPHYSRALEFRVDADAMTVTKIWEFRDTPDKESEYQGNVQRLPSGNTLINWGMAHLPKITEVRPDGTKAFEMNFENPVICYRVFKFPWQAKAAVPFLVIESASEQIHLLFNKFGDEVALYRVYGGVEPHPLQLMKTTSQPYWVAPPEVLTEGPCYYFRVTAVDADGTESGFSNEETVQVDFVPPGTNLLVNGGFSGNMTYWNFNVQGSAAATAEIADSAFRFHITESGTEWDDIQLSQKSLRVLNGQTYRFEFDAWAGQARPIEAEVEQDGGQNINYSRIGLTYVKARPEHFSYTFRMNDPTDDQASVVFNAGSQIQEVIIDNVSLMRVSTSDIARENSDPIPEIFRLDPVYPNPFNSDASVAFTLIVESQITLEVIDIKGRTVQILACEILQPGKYIRRIDGPSLGSGVYFLRLSAEASTSGIWIQTSRKAVLIR